MRYNKPVVISPDIHISAGFNQNAITVRKQNGKKTKAKNTTMNSQKIVYEHNK